MRLPLSWIKEFAAIPHEVTPEEIADSLVRVGFEVEEVDYLGKDISGPLVVGRVISIEELSGHKKSIRWVELSCGEKANRYVICGASNFAEGDLVVVALPGAILPGNFAISQRETYGKTSDGMICSVKELGLGVEHSGILVLPPLSGEVGEDAKLLLEIDDVVFDIAVNPDRGYALSIRGISREIAASLGVSYTDPALSLDLSEYPSNQEGVLVAIDDPTTASVIHLRTLDNFNSRASSPLWMQRRLEKSGMRSISLAVDITNYVMLELGQPLHAFDKEKISSSVHIRRADSSKNLTTLDGQERVLAPDDLVVADEAGVLALAGTMGGLSSEVTVGTKSLVVEAARFDPVSVSRNARRHKLFSEASKRFERGVDPSLAETASARVVQLLVQLSGAQYVGGSHHGEPRFAAIIEFDPTYPGILIGSSIESSVVRDKLILIGCDIDTTDSTNWKVDPPSWRNDLTQPADLVEEVARMIGYDSIPSVLPPHPVSPGLNDQQLRRRKIAQLLADRGLVEVQTYPFTSLETLEAMGYTGDRAKAFRIINPMSEDAPLLRTHLLPGLLQTATRNLSRGARSFGLFEIGSIFRSAKELISVKNPSVDSRPSEVEIAKIYASVPSQPIHVGGVLIGQAEFDGWWGKGRNFEWSDSLAYVELILRSCNLEWTINRSDFAPWHPGRCAEYFVEDILVAHAGELHPNVVEIFGLPPRTSAFVINLSSLPTKLPVKGSLIGTFPVAVQDIALIIDEDVPASTVMEALRTGAGELLESIDLFDRYNKIGEGKISLAFTLTFRAPDRTLTTAEVTLMREAAVNLAFQKTGAILRSA